MKLNLVFKQLQIDLGKDEVAKELAEGKTLCEHFFPQFSTYPQWLKETLINAALVPWTPAFVMAVYDNNFDLAAKTIYDGTPRTFRLASRLENKC